MAGNPLTNPFVRAMAWFGALIQLGRGYAAAWVQAESQAAFTLDPNTPVSPADLASLIVKNAAMSFSPDTEAAKSGVDAERLALLTRLSGNPPGPETLLAMIRRSIADDVQATKGMEEGYLYDEWIPQYLQLTYDLLSPGDYVEADLQNADPAQDWSAKAAAAGMDAREYPTALFLAGNPPGPETSLDMWNRGIFDQAATEQALRESRLKDKYIPQFLQLARHRIPMRTINTLLTHGIIDKPTAEAYLTELGFTAQDAAYLSAGATALTAAAHKQLTSAKVIALYEDQIIPAAQAITDLGNLGYDVGTAEELLTLADTQVKAKYVNSAVSKIHTLYVSRRIDSAQAQSDLVSFGVPTAQQTQLLKLWALEQEANVSEIPLTDLLKLLTAGHIAPADFVAKLIGQGYSSADANLLALLGPQAPAQPPTV